jgi:hypothetical protein
VPLIATCGDLIALAFRTAGIVGVGQTPLADDANTGLQLLSNIRAEWQRRRWLVWSLVEAVKESTGAATYTVGPTGDFVLPRPDRIDAAFVRLNPDSAMAVDYSLLIIEAREDFSEIALKSIVSWPGAVFYESAYPVGVLHFVPVPSAGQFELHIVAKTALPTFDALTDPLTMPPEYMSAMLYSLAVELCMNYGMEPRPSLVARMSTALSVLRMANLQPKMLNMPAGVSGGYNGMGGLMVGPGLGSAFTLNGPSVLS